MTPLATPASTSIGRLRLRGEARAIAAARAPLAAALQQVSWPVTPAGEILILRRVCARGQARELAGRAAAAAREQAAHAVNGWSPGASSADAVRFSSRASLLACLVRDLLQGTAGRHWYWQAWPALWQAPGAAALTRLLLEEPLALPTIIDTLHENRVGPRFWATIGHDGAAEILAQVARVAGWHEQVEAARRRLDTPSPPATAAALPPQAASWPRPRHDLRFLAADIRDARLQLAALLTLWQVAPRQLQGMAGVETLCALVQANRGTAAPHARPAPQAAAAASAPTPAAAPPRAPARTTPAASTSASTTRPDLAAGKRGPRQRSGQSRVTASPAASTVAPAAAAGSPTAATPRAAAASHPVTARDTGSSPMAASQDLGDSAITALAAPPAGHRFLTGQGGLFYLLNFLALPAVQARLPQDVPGSGWRGLYELALAFGCAPHAALLEFLAQACSAESGEALQALPPCVDSTALLRLGAQRYGAEVWRAESWQLPARVVATASHLDIHFRLQDASVAVRRSGLDLNPGWLPWLGRVVTFHYGSGLEP